MRNMKFWRTALVATLVLTVMLSVTGGTIAWFTDTVTSESNKIQAGNLDIDLFMHNGTDYVEITDAKEPIFGTGSIAQNNNAKTLWEPGKTQVAYLKLKNNGNLALKYQVSLNVVDGTTPLSGAMLYAITPDAQNASVKEWNAANAQAVVAGEQKVSGEVSMAAGAEHYFALSIHMNEAAGNEYQNGSATFDITVNATQDDVESDSFGSEYDQDAVVPEGNVWDGTIPAEQPAGLTIDADAKTITINDAAALAYLTELNDEVTRKWEYTIELNADINLMNYAWTPVKIVGFKAFNGNNHTISNIKVKTNGDSAGLFSAIINEDSGATYVTNLNLVNVKVSGAQQVGALVGYGAQAVVDHVTVTNATVTGTKYVGGISGHSGMITNSTVADSSISVLAASEGGLKEAGGLMGYTANDGEDNSPDKVISGNTVKNTVITAPTIASGLVSQTSAADGNIVFQNNKLENVTVKTADATAALYVSNPVGSTYKTNVDATNTADAECKVVSNAGV